MKTLTLRLSLNGTYTARVTSGLHTTLYDKITPSTVRRIGRMSFTASKTPFVEEGGISIVIQKEKHESS